MSIIPQLERDLFDAAEELLAGVRGPDTESPAASQAARQNASTTRATVASRGARSKRRRQATQRLARLSAVFGVAISIAIAGLALGLLGRNHTKPNASAARATSSPQALLDILGVLRRPQTKADLNAALLQTLERQSRTGALPVGEPIRPLVRLATVTPQGAKVFLAVFTPPSERAIARLPAPLRASETRRLADGQGYTLALFVNRGGGCCATAADIEAFGDSQSFGPPTQFVLLVPDGIAKVTVLLKRGRLLHAVTATVHSNIAAFGIVNDVSDYVSDRNMIWYGPSGNVVKRFGHAR